MQAQQRFHTAPSRMRKRDVPVVWDLFALDDRANAPADDDDASSVASFGRPPSLASFASEDTQRSHDGALPSTTRSNTTRPCVTADIALGRAKETSLGRMQASLLHFGAVRQSGTVSAQNRHHGSRGAHGRD